MMNQDKLCLIVLTGFIIMCYIALFVGIIKLSVVGRVICFIMANFMTMIISVIATLLIRKD